MQNFRIGSQVGMGNVAAANLRKFLNFSEGQIMRLSHYEDDQIIQLLCRSIGFNLKTPQTTIINRMDWTQQQRQNQYQLRENNAKQSLTLDGETAYR